MSDVLIKGMKMPKDCPMCPMAHYDTLNHFRGCEIVPGKRHAINDPNYANTSIRPDWCPLVEVPEDVQPVKHGRWISIGHKLSRICSVCDCDEPYKFADDNANAYDYCPHCGARMDGET